MEIPTCLNLALAYLKVKEYQLAIKFATQALSKDPENAKALFRRGSAHMARGELDKAKEDLKQANEITEGKDAGVREALVSLKERYKQQREQEIEFSQRVITSAQITQDIPYEPSEPKNSWEDSID